MCYIYNNISGYQTSHLQVQMLLNYKSYITILCNGANVCPVSSIAVLFIKKIVRFAHVSSLRSTLDTFSTFSTTSKQMLISSSYLSQPTA